ncbi:MAG: DUF421 domain-containing protein, partial [Phycisphaeraceae bacterium]
AYIVLIVLLRISGKRTLSKMNAFDLIITVAFGSALATILLSKQTTLADGITAFAFLVFGQAVITWLSVRSPRFQKLVKATPSLLYYDGHFLDAMLRRERVTREEVEAAAREQGMLSMQQVQAGVLETDGSITVIGRSDAAPPHDLVDDLPR